MVILDTCLLTQSCCDCKKYFLEELSTMLLLFCIASSQTRDLILTCTSLKANGNSTCVIRDVNTSTVMSFLSEHAFSMAAEVGVKSSI